jgi:hypothetical protein
LSEHPHAWAADASTLRLVIEQIGDAKELVQTVIEQKTE